MAVVVNTNLTALRVSNNLARNTDGLNRALGRLASGSRINRPSENQMAHSLSSKLTIQSKLLNRGLSNVNDGISVFNIADASLSQLNSILNRQLELANQSANGIFSRSGREALSTEYNALGRELDRITGSTSFNGINLLGGSKSANSSRYTEHVAGELDSVNAISSDGRFVYYTDDSGSGNLKRFNTVTGSVETVVESASATNVVLSAGGNRIAFVSSKNIGGQNPTSDQVVFVHDVSSGVTTGLFSPVTGEKVQSLAISADGSTVAFGSANIYDSSGSGAKGAADTGYQYLYDIENQSLSNTGVTVSTASVSGYSTSLSSDGSYVAIALNPGSGADQLNVFKTSDPTGSLKTIDATTTRAFEGFSLATMNDGSVYFFGREDLTGENSENFDQVFKYDFDTGSISQLSSFSSSGASLTMEVANNGEYAIIRSNADLIGENSQGNYQLFRMDLGTNEVLQQTDYTSDFLNTSYSLFSKDGNTFITPNFTVDSVRVFDVSAAGLELSIETGLGSAGSGQILSELGSVFARLKALVTLV